MMVHCTVETRSLRSALRKRACVSCSKAQPRARNAYLARTNANGAEPAQNKLRHSMCTGYNNYTNM